ncbi:MAG: SRPBCC family protein [Acidobacteriota bacterium]|nr:SRPBCC family protein [Acidobacteriota bacterium]
MAETVEVTEEIEAPAERVWAMIADLPRMGEWSPENEGATWLGGATEAAPGARFRGTNRNGRRQWSTSGRIVECEPGRLLAFRVSAGGLKVAEWRYAVEPTEAGCRVTETWVDERGPIVKVLGKPVSGVGDRAEHNRRGMAETLRRIKSAAEAAAAGSS